MKILKFLIISGFSLSLVNCGISDGPSLHFTSKDSGSMTTFITLTNGQSADVLLGQADFTIPSPWSASQRDMTGFWWPGITLTPNGGILVYDSGANRVMGWNSIPSTSFPNVADFVLGQTSWTADSSGIAGKFNSIASGAIDPVTGKYVVSDWGNKRVLIYNDGPPSSSSAGAPFITSNPSVVLGAANVNSAGSTNCTATSVNSVSDIVITPDGKLMLLDNDRSRVLIYNSVPTTNNQVPDLVLGAPDFTTCASGSTAGTFDAPNGLWSNGTKILLSDTNNHRILIWNSWPTQDQEAANVVIGQTTFAGNSWTGVSDSTIRSPYGVKSTSNKLIINDGENGRVLIFNSN